jgi:hypothetical protein
MFLVSFASETGERLYVPTGARIETPKREEAFRFSSVNSATLCASLYSNAYEEAHIEAE